MEELQGQLLAGIRSVWRRRWIVLLVAWVFSIGGWTFVLLMPDSYNSRARIYVDTKTLLTPLLQGIALQSNLDQQVAFMRRTLLSRPNVAQVIRMTDLDLTVQNETQMEELVKDMASKIRLRSQGNDLFTIGFQHNNPRLAQRVVQSVINIFVEQNLGENRTEMEKARAFLNQNHCFQTNTIHTWMSHLMPSSGSESSLQEHDLQRLHKQPATDRAFSLKIV